MVFQSFASRKSVEITFAITRFAAESWPTSSEAASACMKSSPAGVRCDWSLDISEKKKAWKEVVGSVSWFEMNTKSVERESGGRYGVVRDEHERG